jgi:hypothetical protein
MPGRKLRGPWRLRSYNVNAEPSRRPDGGLAGHEEIGEKHPDFVGAACRAAALIGEESTLCVVLDPLREARAGSRRHVFGPEDVVARLCPLGPPTAPGLLAALEEIRERLNGARAHACVGWDCATCGPMAASQLWGVIEEAMSAAGIEEVSHG